MRKINILKAIVDFIWIFAVPIAAPATVIILILINFDGFSDLNFQFVGIELKLNSIFSKLLLTLLGISFLLQIYSLHIFRKVLRYFKQVKIFDDFVISSFNKIGKILIISGTSILVIGFVGRIYLENQITISVGFHPYLIVIVLGLFFQVLSEIFKIAKSQKQENDLTI
jgi:hypothetical protein